jgi:23S rRNA (uracil1939-C5)-methyltransferase
LLLNIEKLVYGGDGLARLPSDDRGRGKAVFVPFVLAGERIEAAFTEQKAGFARARAVSIVEPSPHRVPAPCPYFARCGGCHYQHAAYEHQLEIKTEILRENLRRIAKLALQYEIQVHPSPPWNYRNRSRLQVRTSPEFVVGYYSFASHDVLAVEQCPISSPLINLGIGAVWRSGRAGKAANGVREIEFFANSEPEGTETGLLLELICAPEARRAAVRSWAEDLCSAMPEIVGVTALRQAQKGPPEPLLSIGAGSLSYRIGTLAYRVSPGSFFQTNRFLIDELVQIVTAGESGELALDLYAGVGLFSTALACDIRHIVSVESSQTAVRDLGHNLPVNGIAVNAATETYLSGGRTGGVRRVANDSPRRSSSDTAESGGRARSLPQSPPPDLVVVDPPRAGLGNSVASLLAKLEASRLTYVSCDPATLARDLVPLLAAGYRLDEVHLIDLFPQTYHLETVVKLVR